MMEQQDKLPINITFEIVQHPVPNRRWYDVTAVLSWKEEFKQRMDTAMCWQDEVDQIKEAICFLIGERFVIQEVKENLQVSTEHRHEVNERVEVTASHRSQKGDRGYISAVDTETHDEPVYTVVIDDVPHQFYGWEIVKTV